MTSADAMTPETVSVADAKRRFSELLDRVAAGERILVTRRGRPAVILAAPGTPSNSWSARPPTGFAAIAGALADVEGLEETMHGVVASRRSARDRPAPDLGS